jgi:hypothetical protein
MPSHLSITRSSQIQRKKNRGLRRAPIDLRVGAHPATIDYRHKTIVNRSRGEVVTSQINRYSKLLVSVHGLGTSDFVAISRRSINSPELTGSILCRLLQ